MISTDSIGKFGLGVLAAGLLAATPLSSVALAAGDAPAIARQTWSFAGIRGHFDAAQLQRGFKVYQEVCAACHSLKRVYFRNLAEAGGPMFPRDRVEALASAWPNQIFDGPNDQGQIATSRGQLIKRPARLSDPILGPYDNDQAARAAQNGALPPDLSLITKARSAGGGETFFGTIAMMVRDIPRGYQESGSDYLHALLTGYANAPADMKLVEGMSYNKAFPGHQIAMVPPLRDKQVKYEDGSPATIDQYSRDVTAFLTWAADPKHDERKSMGLIVVLYLAVTTVLFFLAKRRLWSKVPH
jgi:ubiquinol-cytochrome c reductase cytochrome c1 subunit